MSARVVDTVLAVALCVGAGVLLSTVFIHMVPETRESLDIAAAQGYLPGRKKERKRRISSGWVGLGCCLFKCLPLP